jgi:hypothetical protein
MIRRGLRSRRASGGRFGRSRCSLSIVAFSPAGTHIAVVTPDHAAQIVALG